MKLSDAMEAGFATVGKQCFGTRFEGPYTDGTRGPVADRGRADACCALQALDLGHNGKHLLGQTMTRAYIMDLNDNCRMPIVDIVEVLRGMGL